MIQGHWFGSNRLRLQVILYYSLSWASSEWNVGVCKFGPRGKSLGDYVTALHQSGRTWKYNKLDTVHFMRAISIKLTSSQYYKVHWHARMQWAISLPLMSISIGANMGLPMTLNVLEGHSLITSPCTSTYTQNKSVLSLVPRLSTLEKIRMF